VKLDPGTHKGMHSILSLKLGVTQPLLSRGAGLVPGFRLAL
jgi:hypothetical protein